ncbi:MAG: hypothetical protein DKM50_01915 [Candidatus Margulisiibacteriota bacterium]|nr:MAG: hypothetical protein A2X43_13230 [Candidatus Margulisbacteria bacterium GWD2_39_127]OGI04780.1 MAG: hypothetical protein A2X42_10765 [Candidatus Margulisbacteria bacterium GWF2_38_17]OGI05725.1 MAG: hypothetical protein A2X41_03350 [Candidatus Margulisbacteria bacterium GWE2_39_32]PZM83660.1 MAG: hypothetical protein DKM50_01915 [Candidatus Margulisiibacteriota bacterium]HAR62078.1 hypothetical protein [Candidatus Margulisiibacteriota bacterium]
MKKQLKISVLTPSYNQGIYIVDNIESVLNQNYPNFEHIVMDGGSSDDTVKVLKKYSHLIWKSEKDKGQTHALNKALKIASGDIVCWLNSDDLLCEGVFEIINRFFVDNCDRHVVTGNLLVVDENKQFLWKQTAEAVTYEGLLNNGQCVLQPSTVFRKNVFDQVGSLNDKFHYTMDHEFFLRASKQFRFYTIDKDIAMFRRYPQSKTGSHEIRFVRELLKIKRQYGARVLSLNNMRLLCMFIKEPFKKNHYLRMAVRILKGKHPDYRYYN